MLEYVPSHFKMVVHVRPKMSCRACETITQAPAPSLPIERGRPGPSLLAHVLVAKCADHLPLRRQSVIYGRAGVELERSTLADWVGQAAVLLEPLAAAITRHARAGVALHADDTPVPVLDPGRGKTKPVDYGCWSGTSAPGLARHRRRSATSTRRAACFCAVAIGDDRLETGTILSRNQQTDILSHGGRTSPSRPFVIPLNASVH